MNRTLRRSCALLVLGGLLVLLGGVSASSSSAVSCPVTGFTVALSGNPVDLSLQNHSFLATVTAVSSACNNEPVTSYKGPATLTASGTNTGGTPGAAGIANIALKAGDFKQGIATPTITPTTDALGVRLTATDDGNTLITGTSGTAFNVFDDVVGCGIECDGQIGDPKGPGGTQVSVDLPGTLQGFLGLSLSDAVLAAGCSGAPTGAVPFGQSYVIAPPLGLANATYTATVRFGKKVAPGTGVSNFVHCMATPRVVSGQTVMNYEQILPCDNKTPSPKCILDQRRNNAGDLVVTFLLGGSADPGGTGMN